MEPNNEVISKPKFDRKTYMAEYMKKRYPVEYATFSRADKRKMKLSGLTEDKVLSYKEPFQQKMIELHLLMSDLKKNYPEIMNEIKILLE